MNRISRGWDRPGGSRAQVRVRRAGRTAWAVGISVALLLAAFGSNGVAREAAASTVVDTSSTITVTATNAFAFSPNYVSGLPTNTSLTVNFINGDTDKLAHTFTLLGCPNVAIPLKGRNAYNVSAYVNGTKCGAPLVNLVPAVEHAKSVSFAAPNTSEWFEFVCTEPGHLEKGMLGFFAFGTAVVPVNYTVIPGLSGAGTAVFIIVGTIVTLTVIAIVLGFVVGRREGGVHEMPPERLGYAEPGSPPLPNARAPPPPHS